jgi:hypothetical protein
MRRNLRWLTLLVLAAPSAAMGGPDDPTELVMFARHPPPQMQRLAFLLGTWTCQENPDLPTPIPGLQRARYRAMLLVRSTLGGYWVQLDYKHLRSADGPESQLSYGMLHWEDRAQSFRGWLAEESSEVTMAGTVDPKGNWSATGVSREEDGDHPYRESIVKKSARQIIYRSERQDERGAWFVNFEDTCKK